MDLRNLLYALLATIPTLGCSRTDALNARPSRAAEAGGMTPSESEGGRGQIDRFVNSIGMKFVRIPSGEFIMGTPDANKNLPIPPGFVPHRVRITHPFYLGVHEVTVEQYEDIIGEDPSWHSATRAEAKGAETPDGRLYPVENVTWHEATKFCRRLSALSEERRAGRRYRLPTEAEWEYACRETTSRPYQYQPDVDEKSITGENAGTKEKEEVLPITPVGRYPPNALGLHDMRGNVWEWCEDWFSPDYYERSPHNDPRGPEWGMLRVVRGSDWVFVGPVCNYPRDPLEPWRRSRWVGFRVVCERNAP